MTNYARGANFERQVKADLEKLGYYVVRSAGSHGVVDLVAFHPDPTRNRPRFVQCKLDGKMGPKDRADFCAVAREADAIPIVASRPSRGRILYRRCCELGETHWLEIEP